MMRGSVYKRGARWWIKVELGVDETGKRNRHQQGGFRTRKDAERALADILHRVDEGTPVTTSKQTLGGFLEKEWLPAIQASVRPSTFESYSMHIRRQIVPALGTTKLQALTPARLNAFYAELLKNGRNDGSGGLSPKSVRNCHVILRKALGDAVKWSLLARNPAQFAEPPKLRDSGDREMQTWTASDVGRFLAAASAHRLYSAFLLAASTGMRRGEILGLRWADVDLDQARVAIRQTLLSVDYRLEFSTPKTAKGRRSIALDRSSVAALREWKKVQLEERMAIGAAYLDSGLVFTKVDGSPLHPDLFSQAFDRLVAQSDLPRIRLHDLRHTHATLALEAGIHPKVVSERLGHSTVAFTLDRYSHAIPAMEADAAERIAALIPRTQQ